jgi:hypothetical protein
MKQFIYIVAFIDPKESVALPDGTPAVCFRHMQLEAEDIDDAYARGMSLLDDRIEGMLLNNYVVELGKPAII